MKNTGASMAYSINALPPSSLERRLIGLMVCPAFDYRDIMKGQV
jgi:hypothetical protein